MLTRESLELPIDNLDLWEQEYLFDEVFGELFDAESNIDNSTKVIDMMRKAKFALDEKVLSDKEALDRIFDNKEPSDKYFENCGILGRAYKDNLNLYIQKTALFVKRLPTTSAVISLALYYMDLQFDPTYLFTEDEMEPSLQIVNLTDKPFRLVIGNTVNTYNPTQNPITLEKVLNDTGDGNLYNINMSTIQYMGLKNLPDPVDDSDYGIRPYIVYIIPEELIPWAANLGRNDIFIGVNRLYDEEGNMFAYNGIARV